MSTQIPRGRFVWHELMSTDVATARKFYTELLGWEVKDFDMGPGGTYHLLMSGGKDFGGLCTAQGGAPSFWVGYVTVDSTDAAAARAQRLGGQVLVPPTDIPNTGRFAIVRDPQGGVTAPFQYGGEHEKGEVERYEDGRFCWNELLTNNVEQAVAFYSELYGWSTRVMDMGPAGRYTIFQSGGKDRCGVMAMPPDAPSPPCWMHYVQVADVDGVFNKAQQLGGKCWAPPQDIPGIGRFAVLSDPSGAFFALFKGAAQQQ